MNDTMTSRPPRPLLAKVVSHVCRAGMVLTLLLTLLLLLPQTTLAQTCNRFVNANSGNDGNDGFSAGTAWQSLEHSYNTAPGGSTVCVASGSYVSGPDLDGITFANLGKSLTFMLQEQFGQANIFIIQGTNYNIDVGAGNTVSFIPDPALGVNPQMVIGSNGFPLQNMNLVSGTYTSTIPHFFPEGGTQLVNTGGTMTVNTSTNFRTNGTAQIRNETNNGGTFSFNSLIFEIRANAGNVMTSAGTGTITAGSIEFQNGAPTNGIGNEHLTATINHFDNGSGFGHTVQTNGALFTTPNGDGDNVQVTLNVGNSGTFNFSGAGTNSFLEQLNNNGVLNVQGTVNVQTLLNNSTNINIPSGHTLALSGGLGQAHVNKGTISGDGTVQLLGTATLDSGLGGPGGDLPNVSIIGGSPTVRAANITGNLTVNHSASNSTVQVTSTVSGNVTITDATTVNLTAPTISGTTSVAAGTLTTQTTTFGSDVSTSGTGGITFTTAGASPNITGNLTVGGTTVTQPLGTSIDITGNLTVDPLATIDLNGNALGTTGAGVTHTINGAVNNGLLYIAGGGTTVQGQTQTGGPSSVNQLEGDTGGVLTLQNISITQLIGSTGTIGFDGNVVVANAYTNSITAQGGGTLNVPTFTNTGTVRPGTSPAVLTLAGDYNNSTGTLQMELDNSTTPGPGHDQLAINGTGTLSGTLTVLLTDGYTPADGDQFVLVTCSLGCGGTFGTVNLPNNLGGRVIYNANDVTFEVVSVAVSLPTASGLVGETPLLPVTVGDVTGENVASYQFTVTYDPAVLNITGASEAGTLSDGWTINANTSTPGQITVTGNTGASAMTGAGTLINLQASYTAVGTSALTWTNFRFNVGLPNAGTPDASPQNNGTVTVTGVNLDRAALEALYDATDGANWTDNTNWRTAQPLSTWFGVTVDGTSGRVTQVILNNNNLVGTLPTEIGDLTELINFRVENNQLTGSIPTTIGNLVNLTNLEVWANRLTGSIPTTIGNLTLLNRFDARGNQLTGSIPTELGTLTALRQLLLGSNQLSGLIPSELGNLVNLTIIRLNNNQLTGGIPTTFGNFTNVFRLDLGQNVLTGDIPAALGNLTALQELELYENRLTGSIPTTLGNLANLISLKLYDNQLTGAVPAVLGNLTNLQILNLSINQLSGSIPAALGNLANLTQLIIRENQLVGAIPSQLGNLTALTNLELFSNQLTGTVPTTLGNLTNLRVLELSSNQLTGSIPTEVGNMTSLVSLWFRSNQMSGAVPQEITNLANLTTFWIDNNAFTDLPDLSGLTLLNDVTVQNNLLGFDDLEPNVGITGFVYAPQNTTIGTARTENATAGSALSLSFTVAGASNQYQWLKDGNAIAGANASTYTIDPVTTNDAGRYTLRVTNTVATALTLTSEAIRVVVGTDPEREALVALYNATDGANWTTNTNWNTSQPLSTWFGVTVDGTSGSVTQLDLGNNNLVGTLPGEIGNLTELRFFELEGNQLTGGIPVEVGNLVNLFHLDIYSNQLTGTLPTELGNLTALTRLDLRENQLTGVLPTELGNLTALTALLLGNNQLSGEIPPSLGNLTNLTILRLNTNQLTGSIPSSFGNFRNMNWLDLIENSIDGSIPAELGNLVNLNFLDLYSNQLTGTLPTELGNLTALTRLDLRENQLTGAVPAQLTNLAKLQSLGLNDNAFTDLPGLSGLTGLNNLTVQNNLLGFDDLEPNMGITGFQYAPQNTVIGTARTENVRATESLTLSFTAAGASNQYQWLKDGNAIAGANANTLTLDPLQVSDSGAYTLQVTNTQVPFLTIGSAAITVNVAAATSITGATPGATPTVGQALPISVTISDPATFVTQRLFFRPAGAQTFATPVDLTLDGTTATGTIPPGAVTIRGVEYYVELVTASSVITFPAVNPSTNPLRLRTQFATLTPPQLDLEPATYRMITLPVALTDSDIASVFVEAYGSYDRSLWRLLRWNPGLSCEEDPQDCYEEETPLAARQGVVPGVAFWYINADGRALELGGGQSVDTDATQEVRLLRGWNQVGNPFAFPVLWDLNTVQGSERVQAPIPWTGQQYGQPVQVLGPWQGYFIFNPEPNPVFLTFAPIANRGAASVKARSPMDGVSAGLQLEARLPALGLVDTENHVGFAEAAQRGWDPMDLYEPPGIGPHVRLSIMAEGEAMARNIVPPGDGATWPLALRVSPPEGVSLEGRSVEVTLQPHGVWADELEVHVLDDDYGRVVPVQGGRFHVALDRSHRTRHLRLIVGTPAYAVEEAGGIPLVPVDYALDQNYPNPFNPETRIRYQLSQRSPVRLAVYDLLGRRVRLLVAAEQQAGAYEVTWDARDDGGAAVASGVYLYQLEAGPYRAVRRMVLLK